MPPYICSVFLCPLCLQAIINFKFCFAYFVSFFFWVKIILYLNINYHKVLLTVKSSVVGCEVGRVRPKMENENCVGTII